MATSKMCNLHKQPQSSGKDKEILKTFYFSYCFMPVFYSYLVKMYDLIPFGEINIVSNNEEGRSPMNLGMPMSNTSMERTVGIFY